MGKNQDNSQGDSQDDSMEEDLIRDSFSEDREVTQQHTPLAAFHPMIGLVQLNSNTKKLQTLQESVPTNEGSQELEVNSQQSLIISQEEEEFFAKQQESSIMKSVTQILVHDREGPYLMDANKWPNLELPAEKENDSQELLSSLSQEPVWEEPPARKKRPKSDK